MRSTVAEIACAILFAMGLGAAPPVAAKAFNSPQEAADALLAAAEKFDVPSLEEMLGGDGRDIIITDDPVLDRERATAFAKQARAKMSVTVDPKNSNRATIVIGDNDWPMPVPLVRKGGKWYFDAKA